MAKVKLPTASADVSAATLKVEFLDINEKSVYSTFSRWATDLTVMSGADYSYALFTIPQKEIEEVAGQVAASYSSSPKIRTRGRVTYCEPGKSQVMLCGSVIEYGHDLDEDAVVGRIVDDRWHLGKVLCFGRVKCDPSTDEAFFWFDAGEPLFFEPLSCIDSAYGPVFAPTFKWGHSVNDFSDPTPGNAKTKARNWRCQDVESYLRFCHYSSNSPMQTNGRYGNVRVNSDLNWPSNLANGRNWARFATNLDIQGDTLLIALQKLCRIAGPYDLYCVSGPGWRGTLSITDMSGRVGHALFNLPRSRPSYTLAQRMADPNHIQGGKLVESGIDFFDEVQIIGDPPVIETSFRTGVSESPETSVQALKIAWTLDRENAFRQFVTDGGNTKSAFLQACDIWPDVFAWYYIDPKLAKIFPDGSKYSSIPVHYTLKCLSNLLSSDNLGAVDNPLEWQPLSITVEVFDHKSSDPMDTFEDTAALWKATDRLDGLSLLLDNRIINLDGLRKRGGSATTLSTWYIGGEGHGSYEGEFMLWSDMRITIPVEHEFRVSWRESGDPNHAMYRMRSYGSKRHTYQALGNPGDYVHYERYKSHPYGQGVDEPYKSENFPDKLGSNPLFSDLLPNGGRIKKHATQRLKDVKRIGYGGSLNMSRFNPSLRPGMAINIDHSVVDTATNSGTVIKSWSFSVVRQQQLVELAMADWSQIYDLPQSIQPEAQTTPAPMGTGSKQVEYSEQGYQESPSTDQKSTDSEGYETSTSSVSKQAGNPAPSKSDRDSQREADAALVRMIEPAEPPKAKPPAGGAKGSIGTPGDAGWERMKYEEGQAKHGIYTGQAMKQLDHDRVKSQRMQEGLTPTERREQQMQRNGEKQLEGTGKKPYEASAYQRKAMKSGAEEAAANEETE